MIFLLNYLHWFITAAAVYLAYVGIKKGSNKWVLAGMVVALLIPFYLNFQVSYGPKGTVQRVPAPEYVAPVDLEVQDRLRKPSKTEEEAKRDFDKMVDWKSSSEEEE